MSAHTHGPWKYGIRKNGSMWISVGDPVTGPHWQTDWHGSKADADLTVSAPDLLEALELFMAEWAGEQSPPRKVMIGRAAIAKANGEAP